MNQRFRVISVIFLMAIYLNAIGNIFCYDNRFDFRINHFSSNIELLKEVNVGMIADISQSIFSLNNFNNERLPKSNNLISDFETISKLIKKRIEKKIYQFLFNSKNILIKYRKNDFIYPFHYFW